MRYIIVDLEATCWEGGAHRGKMEIIEIGAVELASARGPATREFSAFVRPVVDPRLSDFCRQLTSIQQRDVDMARSFWEVFHQFLEWIGSHPFVWCSWGQYDLGQLRKDCHRHGIEMPPELERHVNLKREFCDRLGLRRGKQTLKSALRVLGVPFDGTHHRGIDDARNISKLARLILPELDTERRAAEA